MMAVISFLMESGFFLIENGFFLTENGFFLTENRDVVGVRLEQIWR